MPGGSKGHANSNLESVAVADRRERFHTVAMATHDRLHATAAWMYFLAALSSLGGLISGIVLMAHTTPSDCSVIGASAVCFGSAHNLIGVGIAVLVAGIVQGAVLAAIGQIAAAVGDVRTHLRIGVGPN